MRLLLETNRRVNHRVAAVGLVALFLAGAGPVRASPQTFTIFHVNDMHARLTPHEWVVPGHGTNTTPRFELVGGGAYLTTELLRRKAADPDSLVLDGGDISEGNPLGDLRGNGAMVEFCNLLDAKLKAQGGRGLDASVVGNHDVRLRSYIDNLKTNAHYPVLSLNICFHGTHRPYFAPYTVVTLPQHNGLRVGVLGYTTETSDLGPETEHLLSVVKCDWFSADDTAIHIRDYVAELRANQHCAVVILLAHVGHSAICTDTATTKALLVDDGGPVRVPEVVVSGHWHTWAETAWQPETLNYKTIITESASYMKYLGELRVTMQGQYVTATQHVIRASALTPDPDVTKFIAGLEREYAASGAPALHDVIGHSADDLLLDDRMVWWSPDDYPWNGDNTAGGWICDSMQWKAAQLAGQCDLAMQAGGGVRSDVPAGPVTYLQIYETYPWNDDGLVLVRMGGQEISDYIRDNNCAVALSRDWLVTAHDGVPINITYRNAPLSFTNLYRVALSSYMYAHGEWSDHSPDRLNYSIRKAMVEYTGRFDAAYPMTVPGPRYRFDTAFSGGYRAVVTMLDDLEARTVYEGAFIRLLSATPETLARRGTAAVPPDLVNADGTINAAHRLSEIELYRSFLGFRANALRRGDVVEVWGKSGCHRGDPQLVAQGGVESDKREFNIVGYDETLAQPEYASCIEAFWNGEHKNHYVKFLARKAGRNAVVDRNGATLTVMDATAHAARKLPGNNGALLQLTGVPTSGSSGLRFRCDSVTTAASLGLGDYPPASAIQPVSPVARAEEALTLTATVKAVVSGGLVQTYINPSEDAQVVSAHPDNARGAQSSFYVQSANKGSFGNERAWLKFDLSTVPAAVTGARLKLYCWKATGANLPVVAMGSANDTWSAAMLTWNNQPDLATAEPLSTNALASGLKNVLYTWDVTPFVQRQWKGDWKGDKTASFVLKAVTEDSADMIDPSYAFESAESSKKKPYLEVDTVDTVGASPTTQTVAQVRFFYRFSSNSLAWGPWTQFQCATQAPWTASCACREGAGYYDFHSAATDDQGNAEPAPIKTEPAYCRVRVGP